MIVMKLENIGLTFNEKAFFSKEKVETLKIDALKNINIDIEKNSIIGLTGPNGSGKSTLLKVMGGILSPTKGSLISNFEPNLMVHSNFNIIDDANGHENAELFLNLKRINPKEIPEKIELIKKVSGLENFFYQKVKIYSTGMRFRLSFACLEQINSEILLMDEWVSTADKKMRDYVKSSITSKMQHAKATVIASHNIEILNSICNKIYELQNGEIVDEKKIYE